MRFCCTEVGRNGETLQLLSDSVTGGCAKIWPAHGANCVQLVLPAPDGRLVPVIDDQDNLEELRKQPSRYGIPILYPWASRIARGEYSFRGKKYQSRELHTDGDAWHGLVRTRSWEVVSSTANETGATLTCQISTDSHADMLESYPFPNRLRVTFVLTSDSFIVSAEAENIGGRDMPFGIGFHPYFKVPFGPAGDRGRCLLEVPAQKLWNWQALAAVSSTDKRPVSADELKTANTFSAVCALGAREYNEGFTDLTLTDGCATACVIDPDENLAVSMQAGPDVKSIVVYSPPNRNVICLEPWTCTANSFALAAARVEDHGLIVLAPEQTWRFQMRIVLENFATRSSTN